MTLKLRDALVITTLTAVSPTISAHADPVPMKVCMDATQELQRLTQNGSEDFPTKKQDIRSIQEAIENGWKKVCYVFDTRTKVITLLFETPPELIVKNRGKRVASASKN